MKIDSKEMKFKQFGLKQELEEAEKRLREIVKERGLCNDVLELHAKIIKLREKLFFNKSI